MESEDAGEDTQTLLWALREKGSPSNWPQLVPVVARASASIGERIPPLAVAESSVCLLSSHGYWGKI